MRAESRLAAFREEMDGESWSPRMKTRSVIGLAFRRYAQWVCALYETGRTSVSLDAVIRMRARRVPRAMKKQLPALAAFALVAACASRPPVPDDAAGDAFVIERDLAGAHVARGEFKSITGVHRTFTAKLTGTWDGETFTLVEDFVYDDGEKDQKTWKLERIAPGEYAGTREDVVGTARGYQDGRAFRLEYDVVLPSENGNGRKVRFRDVLVKDRGGRVLNTATVGWFGLRVGSVSLVMEPAQEDAE